MGMGLGIQNEGHHIAFTGGTGILVFLDLVAMLVLSLCKEQATTQTSDGSALNINTKEQATIETGVVADSNSKKNSVTETSEVPESNTKEQATTATGDLPEFNANFKFTLYYTAPSEQEAIGL